MRDGCDHLISADKSLWTARSNETFSAASSSLSGGAEYRVPTFSCTAAKAR